MMIPPDDSAVMNPCGGRRPPRKAPAAVFFDLDGTLVTSTLDFRKIGREIGCQPGHDILGYLETLSASERQQAANIIHEYELDDARSSRAMPGVHGMLAHLAARQIRTGIVTRNSPAATHMKLQQTEIAVDLVLTRDDAPPKPAPDALLTLAANWSLDVADCVYVGDYVYDLQAAHRANMHAGLFVEGESPDFADQAHFVFDHFDTFLDVLESYWRQV